LRHTYNAAGWVQDTIDPRGIDARTEYDALGRTTETIANYTGNPETNDSDVAPCTPTTAITMC
jgi:YD repeat-containing protein